jgi:hypothetical protein
MLELAKVLKILDTRFDELNHTLWENKISTETRSICGKTKVKISKDLLGENTILEMKQKYYELENESKYKILRFILKTIVLTTSFIGLFFVATLLQHINTPLKEISINITLIVTISLFMFINILTDLIKPEKY